MYRKVISTALLGSLLLTPSWAKNMPNQSWDLLVVGPQDLPELSRSKAQAMILHELGDGRRYLYLEQQQLSRLVILDVTHPAHIVAVGTSKLEAPAPFDIIHTLGESAILVRYRQNHGTAILDLRKPKSPLLTTVDPLKQTSYIQPLGGAVAALNEEPSAEHVVIDHDYYVVDTANPGSPILQTIIRKVQQEIEENDTGTIFFLGEDGLTVLRHPYVEREYDGRNPR
jgi:hypothetical protein